MKISDIIQDFLALLESEGYQTPLELTLRDEDFARFLSEQGLDVPGRNRVRLFSGLSVRKTSL